MPNIRINTNNRNTIRAVNLTPTELRDSLNQSNEARNTANISYILANNAYTYANTLVLNGNTIPGFDKANSAYTLANNAYLSSNAVLITAIGAFDKANTSVTDYSPAFNKANTACTQSDQAGTNANNAYGFANTLPATIATAYAAANTASDRANTAYGAANTVLITTQSAYNTANSSASQAAIARDKANTACTQSDQAGTNANNAYGASNSVLTTAQAAFARGNTSAQLAFKTINANGNNIIAVSNTDTMNVIAGYGFYVTTNSANQGIIFSLNPTIDATIYAQANTAYNKANTACTQSDQAGTNANNAYGASNTVLTTAQAAYARANTSAQLAFRSVFANGNTITSGSNVGNFNLVPVDTSVYISSNTTNNTIYLGVNPNPTATTYAAANTASDRANTAYSAANTASDRANTAYGASNTVLTTAQAAFARGNTSAQLAFSKANISGTLLTALSNNDTLTIVAGSNISLTANSVNNSFIITAAGGAGSDPAAIATTYAQANTAYNQANSAFNKANTACTQSDQAGINANNAYGFANTVNSLFYFLYSEFANNVVVANGTSITDATLLDGNTFQLVITANSASGLMLPPSSNTFTITTIKNISSNNILIYPYITGTIDNGTVNASVQLSVNSDISFFATASNTWYTSRGANGSSGTNSGGSANIAVSNVAPSSPSANGLWWNSDVGRLFVYYNDGSSSQWVETSPGVQGPQGPQGPIGPASNSDPTAAFNQANAAYILANNAYLFANTLPATIATAYSAANTASDRANTAYGASNTVLITTQAAFGIANSAASEAAIARNKANTACTQSDQAGTNANNAYGFANTLPATIATAYAQANTAYDQANTAYGSSNSVTKTINLALSANGTTITDARQLTGNVVFWEITTSNTGNTGIILPFTGTKAGGRWYALNWIRNQSGNNIFLYPPIGGLLDAQTANASLTITPGETISIYSTSANTWYSQRGANVAFEQTIFNKANTACTQSDQAGTNANNAYGFANTLPATIATAYAAANTASDRANTAYGAANTASDRANTAYGASNTVLTTAQAAYARANTSAQLAFKTINANGNVITAASNADSLILIAGAGIAITTNSANQGIILTSTATGGASVAVSNVAPAGPTANSLWWNSDVGRLFVYYSDNDTSQWVETSPGIQGPQGPSASADQAGINANNAYGFANTLPATIATAYAAANTASDRANTAYGASNTVLTTAQGAFAKANAANLLASTAAVAFIIDGGGSTITIGQKGHLELPFNCTILQSTIVADQSGSANVEIWRRIYSVNPPISANNITGTRPVSLSSATANQDTALTGWNTTCNVGDILAYNVVTATTITRATISLKVLKT